MVYANTSVVIAWFFNILLNDKGNDDGCCCNSIMAIVRTMNVRRKINRQASGLVCMPGTMIVFW